MRLSTALGIVLLWGCRAQVQHALEERDANEVVTALAGRGIEARKVPEKGKHPTFAIDVEEARSVEAMQVLNELKLPRPQKLTTQRIASDVGLIETPGAERARHLEALEGDLEQALEMIDGVTSAAVEIVVPLAPRIGALPPPSKASTLLRVRAEALERLDRQRAELRALVAGSVDGLRVDDVVLVLDEVHPPAALQAPISRETNMRLVIIVLAALLSVLAITLIAVTLRSRPTSAPALVEATPPPARPVTRPVVATAVQRRVA